MSAIDPAIERRSSDPSAGEDCEREMLWHDVRAAFAGIAGGIAQIVQMNAEPCLRAQIERVAASAKDLEILVEIILGSGTPLASAVVDVDRLMSHLRHRFTGEAQEFGLTFRVEMDPSLPSQLHADPATLFRLLENLIRRAMARNPAVRWCLPPRRNAEKSYSELTASVSVALAVIRVPSFRQAIR